MSEAHEEFCRRPEAANNRTLPAVSDPREVAAMALLESAGWTHGELAMTFQVSSHTVGRTLNGVGRSDVRAAAWKL